MIYTARVRVVDKKFLVPLGRDEYGPLVQNFERCDVKGPRIPLWGAAAPGLSGSVAAPTKDGFAEVILKKDRDVSTQVRIKNFFG